VEGDYHWATARSNLFQDLFDCLYLAVERGIGCIDHVHQEISLGYFLQGGPKCSYQGGGQALNETHSIAQEDFLSSCETYTARHGVKRGKELVLCETMRAGKRVEQGGL